jgi:hypothetical protein
MKQPYRPSRPVTGITFLLITFNERPYFLDLIPHPASWPPTLTTCKNYFMIPSCGEWQALSHPFILVLFFGNNRTIKIKYANIPIMIVEHFKLLL